MTVSNCDYTDRHTDTTLGKDRGRARGFLLSTLSAVQVKMANSVTSMARSVLAPGTACRTVGNAYMQCLHSLLTTVQRTKNVMLHTQTMAADTVRMAVRPLLWPVNLSVNLSRRILIQVLITLREVLMTLNDLVASMEENLSEQDRTLLKETPAVTRLLSLTIQEYNKIEQTQDDSICMADCKYNIDSLPLPPPAALPHPELENTLEAWKHHEATSRKLKQSNIALKRRLMMTEKKYEMMNAQVNALKDVYRDKMTDMEYDLNDLKRQREYVLSMIASAQSLAEDCHGDVQKLMDDVHDIKLQKEEECLFNDSLSMDMSLECLTLMPNPKDWQLSHDSDTGYVDDDSESDVGSAPTPSPKHLPYCIQNSISNTSSMASLLSVTSSDTNPY